MTTEETGAQAVFRGLGFESIGMLPGYVMTRDGDRIVMMTITFSEAELASIDEPVEELLDP